jgi:hypothetical protein
MKKKKGREIGWKEGQKENKWKSKREGSKRLNKDECERDSPGHVVELQERRVLHLLFPRVLVQQDP